MANSVPDILLHWTRNLGISVSTLAEWAERDDKTIYGYMSGARDVPYRVLRRMARQVSAEYGDNAPSESLIAAKYRVALRGASSVNHDVDDDIAQLVEAVGTLRAAFRSGDRRAYFDALKDAEIEFNDLHGEGEAL